jgi:L-ascorbate metabolism protein UlaG (beta-lactamase superfamily)
MAWLTCLILLLVVSCPSPDPGRGTIQNNKAVGITYTGNMGVLISTDKTAVCIDGLHEYYGPPYLNPPDSILEKAFAKKSIFSRLQWLLFTHYHRDHFSGKLVKRFLQLSVDHKVIGAPQVIDSFSAAQTIIAWNKNGEILNDTLSFLRVKAFNIPHTWPQRHAKVQNIAFLVELNGTCILHVGDADTDVDAFNRSKPGKVDIVIVPAWFTDNEKGKKIIENLNAKKIIVTHIAPGEKSCNSFTIKNTETVFFETIGQVCSP